MTKPEKIAKILGETGRFTTIIDLIKLTRRGIHSKGLEKLLKLIELSQDEFADAVRISTRTLARRLINPNNLLNADESEKTLRLARIFIEATETLGSEEKAKLWIKRKNKSLGSVTPLQLLMARVRENMVVDGIQKG